MTAVHSSTALEIIGARRKTYQFESPDDVALLFLGNLAANSDETTTQAIADSLGSTLISAGHQRDRETIEIALRANEHLMGSSVIDPIFGKE